MFGLRFIRKASVLSFAAQCILGQQLPDPSTCLGHNVTFSGCEYFQNQTNTCGNIPESDQAALISCFCTQDVFNSIVDCESEIRQCIRESTEDVTYQAIETAWVQTCGPKISFSPTTPALATFTPYPGQAFCEHVIIICQSLQAQTRSCSSQFTDSSAFQSCRCQTDILSAASVCEIDGADCLGNPVKTAAFYSNVFCVSRGTTTGEGITSTAISAAATTTSSNSISSSPGTSAIGTYTTFTPASTAARTISPSSSTSSSAAMSQMDESMGMMILAAAVALAYSN